MGITQHIWYVFAAEYVERFRKIRRDIDGHIRAAVAVESSVVYGFWVIHGGKGCVLSGSCELGLLV